MADFINDTSDHDRWMSAALREAETAAELGEVPIGAVIVKDGKIVGRGGNRIETLKDPTAHAEIIAIGAAAETTGYERLLDTTMYVTLEPCPMCAGAIVLARIPRLVFGAKDPKMGACGSIYNICSDTSLNHVVDIIEGVMTADSSSLMHRFFKQLREKKNTSTGAPVDND